MLVYTTDINGCYNVTLDEQSPEAELSNLTPDPENWQGWLKRFARESFEETTNLRFNKFDLELLEDDEFDLERLEDDECDEGDEVFLKEGLFVNLTQKKIFAADSWAAACLRKPGDEDHQWEVMTPEEWKKVCEDEEDAEIEWEVWLEGPDFETKIDEGLASGNRREDENGESEAWRQAYDKAARAIRFDLASDEIEEAEIDFPGPDGPYQDLNTRETYWISYTPSHERPCDCENQESCGCDWSYRYRIKFIPQEG